MAYNLMFVQALSAGVRLDPRVQADLFLGIMGSEATAAVVSAITRVMRAEKIADAYLERRALEDACGDVQAILDGLVDTGRLRATRVAQARRTASAEVRPHHAFPQAMADARALMSLRRLSVTAHALGAALDEDSRDAAERAAGEFFAAIDDLDAEGVIKMRAVRTVGRRSNTEVAQVLREGGVQ